MENDTMENNDSLNVEDTATETADTAKETESNEVEITLDDASEEVDVAKLQEINKKLFARAKKAEEALKKQKPQVAQPKKEQITNKTEQNYLTREEAILIAKGEDEESLAKIKAIAKGNGVSLLEAQKDEMFQLWKEKRESDAKKSKAKLGASKGSGSQQPAKRVAEMTREEHQKHVLDTMNG